MEPLPNKLQNRSLRFILVRPNDKPPIESRWQHENNYEYDDPKLINHLTNGGNVGIVCGKQSDGLRVLDDDSPNNELIKIFEDTFGRTLRIRDHFYFKFDTRESDKIILSHKTKLYPNSKGVMSPHVGECQGTSTFVVTCPSIHPDGSKYELIDDKPIQTISYEKFREVFKDYLQKPKTKVTRAPSQSNWSGDNITDIPIGNILGSVDLQDMGNGCLQGAHPVHGSNNGKNFRVNITDNTWYCFRCQSGGGPSELIAVMEGIVDCSQVGPSCYSTEQAQEVIKVARDKYGLTVPEQDLGEVRGWAKSVTISKLANKRNFNNCPTCKKPWNFQDSHGLFYCDECKYGGGLPKFVYMINEARKEKETVEAALEKL